eukprot:m.211812 g.211812  ORF g.211812 m.211812 type:complete len:290 (+) comp18969_c0_seq1:337-1206(+)
MSEGGDSKRMRQRRRVGIVGYGKLGQYLVAAALERPDDMELAFVWNRSAEAFASAPAAVQAVVLQNLDDFASRNADLIIEVAHPCISKQYGARFLAAADYMVGSPTALADQAVEASLRAAAANSLGHGLYVPSGAFWGADDIQRMSERGTLKALSVTMKKHPSSFKLEGDLATKNAANAGVAGEVVLFDGPVRELCPLAPNNVNTMACAAFAAANLGFDVVRGRLISDNSLEAHIVEIEAVGPGSPPFVVKTVRYNPAKVGAVTGDATYSSFVSSMVRAHGRGAGVHFC